MKWIIEKVASEFSVALTACPTGTKMFFTFVIDWNILLKISTSPSAPSYKLAMSHATELKGKAKIIQIKVQKPFVMKDTSANIGRSNS